jgi:hypothetical protein
MHAGWRIAGAAALGWSPALTVPMPLLYLRKIHFASAVTACTVHPICSIYPRVAVSPYLPYPPYPPYPSYPPSYHCRVAVASVSSVSSAAACTLHPLSAPRHAGRFKWSTRSCTSPLPVTLRPGSGPGFHTCQTTVLSLWPLPLTKPPCMCLSCLLSCLLDSGLDCAPWHAGGSGPTSMYVVSQAAEGVASRLLLPQQLGSSSSYSGRQIQGQAAGLLQSAAQLRPQGPAVASCGCRHLQGTERRGCQCHLLQVAARAEYVRMYHPPL